MPKRSSSGFTLIELLVVISIIAILSAIGLVSYNGIRNNALKAKRLSDLNAIKKAYEANYDPTLRGGQGGYKGITDSNFASGQTPKRDDGSSYIVTGPVGSGASGGNFAACINTLNGSACTSSSQTNCSCVKSDQGVPFTSPTGGSNPSCDPFGVLTQGLVGYWKMDESPSGAGSWTVSPFTVTDSSGLNNHGVAGCAGTSCTRPTTVTTGSKFTNSGSFIGTNNTMADFVRMSDNPSLDIGTGSMSWVAWVKTTKATEYILRKSDSSGSNGVILELTGGKLSCGIHYPSVRITSTVTVNDDSWNMVSCVLDRSSSNSSNYTLNIYKDSTNIGSVNASSLYSGGSPINLDAAAQLVLSTNGLSYPLFSGLMDDVRIYNKALSPGEIGILYGSSGTGCIP